MGKRATGTRLALALSWLCLGWLPGVALAAVSDAVAPGAVPLAVRATFMLRFSDYVEWPAPPPPGAELRIAVLGDVGMVAGLQQAATERPQSHRRIVVAQVRTAAEARDAHVLFIGASRNGSLRSLSRQLGSRPVLLVTAEPGALGGGSMINFVEGPGRVRFEVGLAAAHGAGLRISSELLSVAARVEQ